MVLKPVDKNLALLFLLLNSIGVAIQCLSNLNLFASQLLLSDPEYLKVFQADQLHAQAMFFTDLYVLYFSLRRIQLLRFFCLHSLFILFRGHGFLYFLA